MVSDLLWAYSVKLLNPALCTMGLSLTIPLAMVVDIFLHGTHYGAVYIIGTLLILAGFSIMCAFEHPRCGFYLSNFYLK
jgi:solute carrier family 35 protein F5